ncbi:MAG: IS630 transposase-related protein, partial [Puniceicoccales bacterium]|nr:IS630 transposase-related protein [Puniceicoccales bacterium]
WKKKLKETGSLEREPLNRKYRKLDPEKLVKYVEEHPDDYQREMARKFNVSKSCIGKALRKLKITVKKKTRAYKERNEKKREEYGRVMSAYKKKNIVYVDESGMDRHLHRRNARSVKGKKVIGFVAGKKFQRRTS